MNNNQIDQARQQLDDCIKSALKAGADAADALIVEGQSLNVAWRNGKLESLEQSEGGDLGLRVLFGKRQASAATTDRSPAALKELVERVVSMARLVPEDPFCGLADPSEIADSYPDLPMGDAYECDAEPLIAHAKAAEEGALAVSGVTQCESTDAGCGKTSIVLAASNGFSGHYFRTSYGISASVLAGEGLQMEIDHDFSSVVFQEDLEDAALIGRRAGEKAVKNLGARKMPSCQVPVVFDPQESHALIGTFAGAIMGSGVARGTSFLKDSLGKQVFPETFTIIDDPFRARGMRSKAFDGEGILPTCRKVVENGILTTWLMDLRSARQLGMKSTGHAGRGTTGVPSPSPTNFYLEAGDVSPAELIRSIKSGFYVTQTMGMGVNGVTGDYSQAARGFWIENGEIVFPVSEMTIAGNLKDMFLHMAAANDLTFKYGIDAPTLCVEGMTVAGM